MRRPLALAAALALCACSAVPAQEPISTVSLDGAPGCATQLSGEYAFFDTRIVAEAGRQVPVTVLHPKTPGTYPLIAFSHGAFAAPGRYLKMLGPLAAAGNIVVAPMHVDSEEFESTERAGAAETWETRNEDMRLALTMPAGLEAELLKEGFEIDLSKVTAMGHSYGALMAQLAGGARAIEDDGAKPNRRNQHVDAVVAWSPPGMLPGRMEAESWRSLAVPSLTITGTADVLPGFIDNWEDHKASYDYAPVGSAALWVGDGVDHYFGGVFGREKPADAESQRLFGEALEQTLAFLQRNIGSSDPCSPGELAEGEMYETR